jgi:hypothetical protein
MPALARTKELPSENLSLEEQIQRRAYELYVERGNQSGSELDDWLQAETEILDSQEQAFSAKRVHQALSVAPPSSTAKK